MIDIKRLIKAWEIFQDINPYEICDSREFSAINEPAYCMGQMIDDTLELLKEHEPRIMMQEEVEAYNGYCWFEKKNTMVMYTNLIKDGLVFDFDDPPYNVELLNWPYYGKNWRCWSAQPTDEQRKAVKWNE